MEAVFRETHVRESDIVFSRGRELDAALDYLEVFMEGNA